jgi:type II secretion system protein G
MRKQSGFTLIELMIVIAIIGLLVAIVIPDLLQTRMQSEIEACKASLRGLQSALELYYTHYKYYPDNMKTLITEGYLSENSDKDPWQHEFMYQPKYGGGGSDEGSTNKTASNYLLGSAGPDGKKGTDDDIDPPINSKRHSFKQAGDAGGSGASGETGGSSTGGGSTN